MAVAASAFHQCIVALVVSVGRLVNSGEVRSWMADHA